MCKLIILLCLLFYWKIIKADELSLADSHAPITVMSDHMHKSGEVMFSYRFNHMVMKNVMNGTKKLSIESVTTRPNGASDGSGTYMNSPISMKMDMHMFGAMYAPNDNLTLMAMGSFLKKEMTQQRMRMAGSGRFDVNSSGIGDTRISGLIKLFNNNFFNTHLGIGLSLPTGSIDKRDNTPVSSSARLGYSMQNGSGTYDPFILLNNVNNFGKIKLGQQFFYKSPASGKNSKNYEYGNSFNAVIWSSYRWVKNISTSLKVNYNYQTKMKGSDDEMNPRMSPAMDSKNKGHQKLNLGFGINLVNHNETLKNHRVGIEGIFPIYQRYRGIQMKETFRLTAGWQYAF